jgi:ADP-heptose:LPS heptosyltransferase
LAATQSRRKILIIRLGAFGDVLQSEGAIHDIRLAHPGDEITLLTTKPFRRIYERCPWIDRIMVDPRAPRLNVMSLLRLRRELRDERFELIYDLQNSSRTLMYRNWLDAEWSQKDEAFLSLQSKRLGRRLSILERLKFQLEQAGLETSHTMRPDVSWMADDVTALMEANALKPGFILLLPGSSLRHPQKRWPHYGPLAQSLIDNGHQVVTAPGPDEMGLCQSLPAQAILDQGKPITFNALAGLIRHAKLIIGNDTGPTHLAAYLGAKGLALFGSHTSARATGLDAFLDIIEVKDLATLQRDEVMARVKKLSGEFQKP